MPFIGLFDEHKQELKGGGYRRVDVERDRIFRRKRRLFVRWPPATKRWAPVHYVALFKGKTDAVSVDHAKLPMPKVLKKRDTIVLHIHNSLRDIARKVKRMH